MELYKLEQKLKEFFPAGKEVYIKYKKCGYNTYFDIHFRILKMEYEIERVKPLRIAVYLKLSSISGFVRRKIGIKIWKDSNYISDTDTDFFHSVFFKYMGLGVYFLKIKNAKTDKSLVIEFKN